MQSRIQAQPDKGVWDMRGKQFHRGVEIHHWVLLTFAQVRFCPEDKIRSVTRLCPLVKSEVNLQSSGGHPALGRPRVVIGNVQCEHILLAEFHRDSRFCLSPSLVMNVYYTASIKDWPANSG